MEICNNNVWGTICDDSWGTPDATVACRQLGFSATGAQALTGIDDVSDGACGPELVHCMTSGPATTSSPVKQ